MELALYCPDYGFYEKEGDNVGRGGDFFTSVSVGPLFGELLAFQFVRWLEAARTVDCGLRIIEAGAHDGRLAGDILSWLGRQRPDVLSRTEYCLLEPSARRRGWQRKTLAEFPSQVRWLEDFPASQSAPCTARFTVVFSNELLDAMPLRRFGWDAKRRVWFEWGVGIDGDRFVWVRLDAVPQNPPPSGGSPAAGPLGGGTTGDRLGLAPRTTTGPTASTLSGGTLDLENLLAGGEGGWVAGLPTDPELLAVLPEDFTVELSPAAEQWWGTAAHALTHGRLMAVDYGLDGASAIIPERPHGTLRAYRGHRQSGDVLADPGEQDLTAHVNFARIEQAGLAAGLRTDVFEAQGRFLTGLAAEAWKPGGGFGEWDASRTRQFQTLTHPEHLGKSFRVLVQSRGCNS